MKLIYFKCVKDLCVSRFLSARYIKYMSDIDRYLISKGKIISSSMSVNTYFWPIWNNQEMMTLNAFWMKWNVRFSHKEINSKFLSRSINFLDILSISVLFYMIEVSSKFDLKSCWFFSYAFKTISTEKKCLKLSQVLILPIFRGKSNIVVCGSQINFPTSA